MLDTGLPARLRDIAANLTSSVRAEQKSVTDEDLRALTTSDALMLAEHLARAARDRPTEQVAIVSGLLRVTRIHQTAAEPTARLLSAIPPDDLQPGAILRFTDQDLLAYREVLQDWSGRLADGQTRRAIEQVLGGQPG